LGNDLSHKGPLQSAACSTGATPIFSLCRRRPALAADKRNIARGYGGGNRGRYKSVVFAAAVPFDFNTLHLADAQRIGDKGEFELSHL
jgi:hypothetical protein